MPAKPNTRNNTNTEENEIVEKSVPCSTKNCRVKTKVFLPSDFKFSKNFIGGFCAAARRPEPASTRSYANTLINTMRNEKEAGAILVSEVRNEQSGSNPKTTNSF